MIYNLWNILKKISCRIDRSSVIVGQISSYFVLLSILLITISVILRYFFNLTYVALDEIQYYCYSIVFLFGFSYIYKEDGHIRVDVFYQKSSKQKKKIINLLGTLCLTIPWIATVCYYSFKFFQRSYTISERSAQPMGLPALYILKFILFLAFVLFLLQAFSEMIKTISGLNHNKENEEVPSGSE